MRRIGYALLLLFAAAWCLPAYANVPCYGGTVVYAPTVADCPKRITDVSITPTVGGFDLGYTSEGGVTVEIAVEAGHDQKCPGCPYATGTSDLTERRINWNRLDDQAIKNATGMSLNSQQDASTAGNYSISITGLANGTDYSIHLLPIEADDTYGQAWQRNVTTLSTAAPTNDEPEWYAGTGGNDLADGLTRATRFATLAPAVAAVDVGDDVAIEPGSVFNDYQLNIPVSGSAADMSIWGTNYESGGADYWWWEGPSARATTRAEINGTFDGCADTNPITCDVGTYNGSQPGFSPIPSNIFAGLVDLGTGKHHIRFGGVAVHDSAARGIDMHSSTNIVINDIDMDRVAHVGIMAERGSKYIAYVRNLVDRATAGEQAEQEGRLPGDWIPQANIGASSQPSCIKICVNNHLDGWDSYCGAWGNIVRNCSGEAFGIAVNRHNWIEQNITHDTSLSKYTDHSRYSYVLRNLAAGSGNGSQINQSGHTTGAEGTAVNRGEGQGSQNEFRAWNITVGTALGIGLRNIGSENVTAGLDNWAVYYHNTVIQPIQGEGIVIGAASGIASVTADNDFRANVIWADTAADMCRKDISIGTIDYQSWSGVAPSDPQCVGANDTTASLTWPHTAQQYKDITYDQAVSTWTLADYKPTGANENAAPVISVPAWATTDLASSEWDFIRQYDGEGYFMWGAAGCVVNVAAASLLTGADCQGLDGTPDIGAVQ